MKIEYCGIRKNLRLCELSDIRCAEIVWKPREAARAEKIMEHLEAVGLKVDWCMEDFTAQIIVENHDEYEKVAEAYKAAKKLYK